MRILHVGHYDKFLPKHIEFTNEKFRSQNHFFLMMDKEKKVKRVSAPNVKYIGHKRLFFHLWSFYRADKIILHGLFEKRLLHLLFVNPWLIKKCYWLIWGGDLYNYQANKNNKKKRSLEFFRRFVIQRLPRLVTYVKGDVENARQWYSATGEQRECLLYHSNVFRPAPLPESTETATHILAGNSASLSNNHMEIFELLRPYKDQDIRIHSPLSYGKESVRKKVISKGKEIFGDKFIPIVDLMPLAEYLKFLGKIDIAIFHHRRQQAMGNIINLLGLGKKVWLSPEVSSFKLFNELGIKVFDNTDFDLEKDFSEKSQNQERVASYFSEQNLENQWRKIYEEEL